MIAAAGVTKVVMLIRIGPMILPTKGRFSKPAVPDKSNAIAATKNVVNLF